MKLLKQVLISARPYQWVKNLVIFAAPLFGFALGPAVWLKSFWVFCLFCVLSGTTYLINDCIDREADRLHPLKKTRPIASGGLSVSAAVFFAVIGLTLTLLIGYFIEPKLLYPVIFYIFLQMFYNAGVKNIPVLDIFAISLGFLIRAWAGGIATGIPLSSWLIITVGFLALFLAIEKRKSEFRSFSGAGTRKVLESYSMPWLNQLSAIITSVTIICYSLWTIEGSHSDWMIITIPIVVYGLFSYQQESTQNNTGEQPEKLILKSPSIIITIVLWVSLTACVGLLKF